MNGFSLLRVDHLAIETDFATEVVRFFVDKLNFRRCRFSPDSQVVRGQCRIKIQTPSRRRRRRVGSAPARRGDDDDGGNGDDEDNDADRAKEAIVSSDVTDAGSVADAGSVTDVAFVVVGMESLLNRLDSMDEDLVLERCRTVADDPRLGAHKRAVVKSVVGNVMHTLIEIDDGPTAVRREEAADDAETSSSSYETSEAWDRSRGKAEDAPQSDDEVSTLDHVAFACRIGESESILRWYEQVFQMKSFDFGEGGDGIRIEVDDIGMQLKALEYWRCSEKGLYAESRLDQKFPLFVVAEPLPGVSANNQIDVFVSEHGGPGIQHLGLNTSDICRSKKSMQLGGVSFIEPPPTYYEECGKLRDIVKAGEDPAKLEEHGVLIDYEDFSGTDAPGLESGYLMQVFTKPIFSKRTFFMELIERRGARGFGAGNITALFKAVQAYMRQES